MARQAQFSGMSANTIFVINEYTRRSLLYICVNIYIYNNIMYMLPSTKWH